MTTQCVIFFADLAGSVQIYRQMGDEVAKAHILELQKLLGIDIVRFRGSVQEIIGDELMALFDNANDALGCATALHQCADNYSRSHQVDLHLRIGLHYGSVIIDKVENRLFGDTLNLTSRITSIAQADQTITTDALLNQASSIWRASVRLFDITPIKGMEETLVIYDLPWKHDDLTNIMSSAIHTTEPASTPKLSIAYRNTRIDVSDTSSAFIIGRAINNDLVVRAESVSRRHVSIECRRNHFTLTEQSTNGTHIYLDNGETLYLRREQFALTGSGEIALGAPREVGKDHIVRFTNTMLVGKPN